MRFIFRVTYGVMLQRGRDRERGRDATFGMIWRVFGRGGVDYLGILGIMFGYKF